MKLLKTLLLSTALAIAPLAAHAEVFNFSYSFDPNNTGDGNALSLTGSFSGNLTGSIISSISNFSVSLNGASFSGPLLGGGWNSATQAFDSSVAPVVSSNVALDNFIFADTDVSTNPSGVSNYFWFTGGQLFAINFNQSDATGNAISGFESADPAKWTVAAVPEPSSYAMLLAGLGLMVMVMRRRVR